MTKIFDFRTTIIGTSLVTVGSYNESTLCLTAGRNSASNSEFGDVVVASPWQKQHWDASHSRE